MNILSLTDQQLADLKALVNYGEQALSDTLLHGTLSLEDEDDVNEMNRLMGDGLEMATDKLNTPLIIADQLDNKDENDLLKALGGAVEGVLIASEDNGDMNDIDWNGLRQVYQDYLASQLTK